MTVTASLSAETAPPLPLPNALTAFFWESLAEGKLRILRCQNCGHFVHYPRPICDNCQAMDLKPEEVSGRATLYSYTWATQAFHPYFVDKIPYNIAVVELVEQPGLRLTTNIIDCPREDVRTGMDLEVAITEVVSGLTLPLFRPATSTNESSAGKVSE
ncbi:Zn-ribbon domain-containing OB-fold protein [Jatrophihabitans sp. DSM 45814]